MQHKKQNHKQAEKKFLIVGVGASAGGLAAFKEFFDAMPDRPGMAFILVQHMDPNHKSMLAEILSQHTSMQVEQIKDRVVVKPDTVYVIPPAKNLAIFKGVLRLLEPQEQRGARRPIDFFFRSLAEDQKENAVGIILSGTGTEGAISLKLIHAEGGLTMVQDPHSAEYNGMPRNAIARDNLDWIGPVSEMPKQLLQYKENRKVKLAELPPEEEPPHNLLEKIFNLLRMASDCDFRDYKPTTVLRRIEKRMALNQLDTLEGYVNYLKKHPEETGRLYRELLIGVTSFFRDPDAFEQISKKVIPHIIKKKEDGDTVRIWIPACSTGEEAYSLAILFNHATAKANKSLHIQVFASDIDNNAIHIARIGAYSDHIRAHVEPELLKRYFQYDNNKYKVKKEIRDQIIFAEQNLLKDPPFSKLDMISCRNFLIYLTPAAQEKVFGILHYALNPGGVLFLGSSESIGDLADLFTRMDKKHPVFLRKNTARNAPEVGFQMKDPVVTLPPVKPVIYNSRLAGTVEKLLLSRYAPACAVTRHNGDAVYFSGNTGKYLQPSPGEARLNVIDMAREGLQTSLRNTLLKVQKSGKQEICKNVQVKTDDHLQLIDLFIKPLVHFAADEKFVMIIFEERKASEFKPGRIDAEKEETITDVSDLEQELASTKEHLRSTIEELKVSNDELKSTVEELKSANEELQSTNEELETSKEELQSVNEEIVTINSELQGKIDELARMNDDMNNLLASTEIGTVFLDTKLNIKRFTPSATKIIHLIQSDVGRPIGHLTSNLIYDTIESDTKKVLDKLQRVKTSVQSREGQWYQMDIMPYRTYDDTIEGVVITFVDISEMKKMEANIHSLNKHLGIIEKSLPLVTYICLADAPFTPLFAGENSEKVLGYTPEELTQQTDFWASRIHPEDKKEVFEQLTDTGSKPKNFEFRWKCGDGKYKHYISYVKKVKANENNHFNLVGFWQEKPGSSTKPAGKKTA